MNARLNVIHGDLHLNNTTLQPSLDPQGPTLGDVDSSPKKYLYVIDSDVYALDCTQFIGTVIDFSRGFMLSENAESMERQKRRISSYYTRMFPEFSATIMKKMQAKMDEDFPAIFKIFSAIDMYVHTDRLLKYMRTHAILNVHTKVHALVEKINMISTSHLKGEMEEFLSAGTRSSVTQYPNRDIITKCFSEFIVGPSAHADICASGDIYFFNNPLKYSLGDFDKMPPILGKWKMKKNNEIVDIHDFVSQAQMFKKSMVLKKWMRENMFRWDD